MATVRNVRLYDDAVTTGKISADTIVAADIAAQGVGGAEVSTAAWLLVGRDNSAYTAAGTAAGTVILFGTNMTAIPKVFLQPFSASSGKTTVVTATSTASFTYKASAACTLDWIAVANIEAQSIA